MSFDSWLEEPKVVRIVCYGDQMEIFGINEGLHIRTMKYQQNGKFIIPTYIWKFVRGQIYARYPTVDLQGKEKADYHWELSKRKGEQIRHKIDGNKVFIYNKDITLSLRYTKIIHDGWFAEINGLLQWSEFRAELNAQGYDIPIGINFDIDLTPAHVPDFRGKLRKYQAVGIGVLSRNHNFLLADATGLGKTIQALGTILELDLRRSLVLTRSSVMEQWKEEIERFTDLSVIIAHGTPKYREWAWREDTDIYITTYRTFMNDSKRLEFHAWEAVFFDEGHKLKSPKAQTTKICAKINSYRKYILTATPIRSSIEDLFHLVNFLKKGYLGTKESFRNRYTKYRQTRYSVQYIGLKNTEELKELLKTVMLKRTKSEVASELPEVTTQTLYVEPTKEQHSALKEILSPMEKINNPDKKMEYYFKNQVNLRKISAGFDMESSKEKEILEIVENFTSGNDWQKVIIFTFFATSANKIHDILGDISILCTGQTNDKRGAIEEFRINDNKRVLIGTEAISEGMNLQFCSNMINYDLPYNPSVYNQRLGRIYRIGQEMPLTVVNLVCGDIEKKIMRGLKRQANIESQITKAEKELETIQEMNFVQELMFGQYS